MAARHVRDLVHATFKLWAPTAVHHVLQEEPRSLSDLLLYREEVMACMYSTVGTAQMERWVLAMLAHAAVCGSGDSCGIVRHCGTMRKGLHKRPMHRFKSLLDHAGRHLAGVEVAAVAPLPAPRRPAAGITAGTSLTSHQAVNMLAALLLGHGVEDRRLEASQLAATATTAVTNAGIVLNHVRKCGGHESCTEVGCADARAVLTHYLHCVATKGSAFECRACATACTLSGVLSRPASANAGPAAALAVAAPVVAAGAGAAAAVLRAAAPSEPHVSPAQEQALFLHAVACRQPHCRATHCASIKALLAHGRKHTSAIAEGHCPTCREYWSLLQVHARSCKAVGGCPVPHCAQLKSIGDALRGDDLEALKQASLGAPAALQPPTLKLRSTAAYSRSARGRTYAFFPVAMARAPKVTAAVEAAFDAAADGDAEAVVAALRRCPMSVFTEDCNQDTLVYTAARSGSAAALLAVLRWGGAHLLATTPGTLGHPVVRALAHGHPAAAAIMIGACPKPTPESPLAKLLTWGKLKPAVVGSPMVLPALSVVRAAEARHGLNTNSALWARHLLKYAHDMVCLSAGEPTPAQHRFLVSMVDAARHVAGDPGTIPQPAMLRDRASRQRLAAAYTAAGVEDALLMYPGIVSSILMILRRLQAGVEPLAASQTPGLANMPTPVVDKVLSFLPGYEYWKGDTFAKTQALCDTMLERPKSAVQITKKPRQEPRKSAIPLHVFVSVHSIPGSPAKRLRTGG